VVNFSACWPERAGAALLLSLLVLSVQGAPLSACRIEGVPHEALCGTLSRPLDAAREGSVRIDVQFTVLPALARNKKPDPVFFLAGGPGQSAIDLAGQVSRMLSRFGQRRDIVLVDQRGTGRSASLDCGDEPPARPLLDQLDPQRQLQRARDCLQRLQALPHGDLRHYGTTAAMVDLDAVRQALGAERINLVGVSYGTRAALEYLRLHPQHVRRVVLDGVTPPDMALPEASAADAQAAFDALLQSCVQDAVCRARHPQLHHTWQALLASLPRPVSVAHPLTGRDETLLLTRDMLRGMVRAALYAPTTAAALPAALDAAAQGRFGPLVGLASALAPARHQAALAQGMHFSVVCTEDLPGPAAPPPAADFDEGLAPLYREVCAFWPRGQLAAGFRQIAPAPVAALLLSGGIDPATPPRHGERVARALGAKARHELVPNAGHGLLALPCVRDAVFRFVDAANDVQALRVATDCARDIPRPPVFVPLGAGLAP
jgi:pimeloyl-ACP methyl ester carboxylesterase